MEDLMCLNWGVHENIIKTIDRPINPSPRSKQPDTWHVLSRMHLYEAAKFWTSSQLSWPCVLR
jgi:hypothetical protein